MQDEQLRGLGEILGVFWDAESAESLAPDKSSDSARRLTKKPTEVMYPLALVIRPEFSDIIQATFGKRHGIDAPNWAKVQEDSKVELWDMGRDAFKKFVGAHVTSKDYGKRVD